MNVANALQPSSRSAEQQSIERIPTESPEAYALFLRALSLGGGTNAVDPAALFLDEAIRLDPAFALAYALKGWVHANVLTGNVPDRQAEFERIAQENAEIALDLDPTLPWPHASLAYVHQAHWRWDEAEAEFAEALRLSPNDVHVLNEYSRTKRYRGEYDEAVEAVSRAAELDPQNYQIKYQLGIAYKYVGDLDAAAQTFSEFIVGAPAFGNGHAQLGYIEVARGNWTEAEASLRLAEQLYGDDIQSQRYPQLANGYSQMGQREDVERLLGEMQERAESSPVNDALWALMYIALEDYDASPRLA